MGLAPSVTHRLHCSASAWLACSAACTLQRGPGPEPAPPHRHGGGPGVGGGIRRVPLWELYGFLKPTNQQNRKPKQKPKKLALPGSIGWSVPRAAKPGRGHPLDCPIPIMYKSVGPYVQGCPLSGSPIGLGIGQRHDIYTHPGGTLRGTRDLERACNKGEWRRKWRRKFRGQIKKQR